ncbi:MAG: hypothetical protein FWG10_06595 [Eubacteriaceae bacterium]|nr:hypothetical protein [Eubacteriaceae bacterium]
MPTALHAGATRAKNLIKKIISAILSFALVCSLASCGPSQGNLGNVSPNKGDGGSDAENLANIERVAIDFSAAINAIESGQTMRLGWPAPDFPQGHPKYPDGNVVYAERLFEGRDLLIFIADTSKESYDEYLKTIEADGWSFIDPDEENEDYYVFAIKGNWSIGLSYYEGYGTGIYISNSDNDLEALYAKYDWPENLPVDIPVYPDGDLELVDEDEEFDFFSFLISGTSMEAAENYKQQLVAAGWTLDAARDLELKGSYKGKDGTWSLMFMFNEESQEEASTLYLGLFFMEDYGL